MQSVINIPLLKFLFFGNYFYGICVIALSIEATVQQEFPVNSIVYFLTAFSITVVFYTKAYINDSSGYPSGDRDRWYFDHKKLVRMSQSILSSLAIACVVYIFVTNSESIKNISALHLILFLIFPAVAILYYGIGSKFNLREIGWLKPFIIGFSWAGAVTWYPILFYTMQKGEEYNITLIGTLLFLKNFMFISVLCILFDIKDYASDSKQDLKTFVVTQGLRKTIFYIVIPMCLMGLITFIVFGIYRGFHPLKISFNVLPFLLMIIAAYSLHNRKSIMYYLVYIDGLMLLKGICGIIAMVYFSY